jgi:hypothetical protein
MASEACIDKRCTQNQARVDFAVDFFTLIFFMVSVFLHKFGAMSSEILRKKSKND